MHVTLVSFSLIESVKKIDTMFALLAVHTKTQILCSPLRKHYKAQSNKNESEALHCYFKLI